MTDVEIVRAAAEAQGWVYQEGDGGPEWFDPKASSGTGERVWHLGWNPLTNEADCWGLVDSLVQGLSSFSADWARGKWEACFSWPAADSKPGDRVWIEHRESSPDRRRAIVLAYIRAKGVQA